MDKLGAMLQAVAGVQIEMQPNMSAVEKAGAILNVLET